MKTKKQQVRVDPRKTAALLASTRDSEKVKEILLTEYGLKEKDVPVALQEGRDALAIAADVDAQAKEARGNESGYDRERLTVRQETEKEREKARKAIDANVNRNDAESVSKLFEDSPELKSKYEEIMATIDAVEQKRLEKIDAKENVGKQKAADDRKDAEDALWEMDASLLERKEKAWSDFE